jgi:hypothetical protein
MHPRQIVAMALATTALMLFVLLASASNLGSLDFSIGRASSSGAASTPAATAATHPQATDAPYRTWLTAPLTPPFAGAR